MFELSDTIHRDPSMVSREIVGEVILVPIRQNVGDLESIFTLNETAGRAWALMDGEHTLGQIIEQIVSEFEVGSEEAQHDLFELLGQLQEIGAVLKV